MKIIADQCKKEWHCVI